MTVAFPGAGTRNAPSSRLAAYVAANDFDIPTLVVDVDAGPLLQPEVSNHQLLPIGLFCSGVGAKPQRQR